jgi:hypothetical protein
LAKDNAMPAITKIVPNAEKRFKLLASTFGSSVQNAIVSQPLLRGWFQSFALLADTPLNLAGRFRGRASMPIKASVGWLLNGDHLLKKP